jgi:hypothetical protein
MTRSSLFVAGTALVVVTVAGAGACTAPGKPAARPALLGESGCFYARDVQDFSVLDRSRLVVYAPNRSNAYQILVSPPASELNFTESIAFLPPLDQICGRAGDRLLVGPPGDDLRLAIIDVRRLGPGDLESLGIGAGAESGPDLPAPRPGPGAEVEGTGKQPAAP